MEDNFTNKNHGAGIATTAFGIMKNIVGSGIVCLPQAMLYGSIIPCILMTSSIFLISTYSFFLIGKLCIDNNTKSYKDLWNKAFKKRYGWLVDAAILSNCVGGSVCYVILFGDFGSHLLESFGKILDNRLIMILCHIPLQLMILPESLDRLKPLCIIGMIAAFYFMCYSGYIGSKFLITDYPEQVKPHIRPLSEHIFCFRAAWLSPFATLCSSFMAHYNAPRFLNEMKDREARAFQKATVFGFLLSFIPNFTVMLFGFFAMNSYGFDQEKGEKKSGNIIKIFVDLVGKNDPALLVCTVLYFINVLISYPFLFFSVRDTIMALIYPERNPSPKERFLITEIIFFTILAIGLTQPKIDMVVRLKGASACPCIAFLFPSILAMKLVENPTKQEKILNYLSLCLGILSIITGSIFTILGWLNIKITNP